jgi:hypothetical protein
MRTSSVNRQKCFLNRGDNQMTRKHLIAMPLLLLCFTTAIFSQDKLGHLKSWDGKKVTSDFFTLAEIRKPLQRLLTRPDFNLITKTYSVGSPFKLMGDFLATSMCRPHNCGDERAGLAINLSTGDMYVRMQKGTKERWIVSAGKASDLPTAVQDYIGDPARTQK